MTAGGKIPLDVGIHYGIPAETYHADPAPEPSLSRSLCWTLSQRAPIHGFLEHPRLNPDYKATRPTKIMEFGDLGHALLLGKGDSVEVGKYRDFKTASARAWREDCWAHGKIPTLPAIKKKADLLRTCALAHIGETGFLDDFASAKTEVTVIAKIDDLYCRARFDALKLDPAGAAHRKHSEIAMAFDVKITGDASPEAVQKQIGNMGYDLQERFYLDTLSAQDKKFAGKTRFVFFFIENSFPFCVTPVELGNRFKAVASSRFHRGFEKWARGIRTGEWPGFVEGEGAFVIEPKKYLEIQELEDEEPYEAIRLAET